jgi:hypothetical protein
MGLFLIEAAYFVRALSSAITFKDIDAASGPAHQVQVQKQLVLQQAVLCQPADPLPLVTRPPPVAPPARRVSRPRQVLLVSVERFGKPVRLPNICLTLLLYC